MKGRRVAVAVAVCLLLADASPVAAIVTEEGSTAVAYGGAYEAAEATWIVRTRRGIRMFTVLAYKLSGIRRTLTAVSVGAGPCRLRPGRPLRRASCAVRWRRRVVEHVAFRTSTALDAAQVRAPGVFVRWTGRGRPYPDEAVYREPGFVDADAGVARRSLAWGRVGDRLFPRGPGGRVVRAATIARGLYAGGETP